MCVLRSAGNWLFCNRRWLDPSHPQDRARLDAGYDALCAAFPAFAACPRAAFLARLARVSRLAARPTATKHLMLSAPNESRPGPVLPINPRPATDGKHRLPPAAGGQGGAGSAEPSPAAVAVRIPHLLNPVH